MCAGKYVNLCPPHLAEPGVDEQSLNPGYTHILGVGSQDKHNCFYPQFSMQASFINTSTAVHVLLLYLPSQASFTAWVKNRILNWLTTHTTLANYNTVSVQFKPEHCA